MQRRLILATLAAAALAGCGTMPGMGWETVIADGQGLAGLDKVGNANWRSEGGLVVADKGTVGFLVTPKSYRDFVLVAEFWAETDTNSGIFIRLSDAKTITADNSYEVNIWDIRPDPKYGTGAIVNFATVPVPLTHKAGGRWNTFEIEARGSKVTVKLNGQVTSVMDNGKFAQGPVALQYGPGVNGAQGGPIKWKSVRIRAL